MSHYQQRLQFAAQFCIQTSVAKKIGRKFKILLSEKNPLYMSKLLKRAWYINFELVFGKFANIIPTKTPKGCILSSSVCLKKALKIS
jgi:hypothetical protein